MRMPLSSKQLGTAYKGDDFSTPRVILSLMCSNSSKASCQVRISFMSQLLKNYKQQNWYWYHLSTVLGTNAKPAVPKSHNYAQA